MAQTITRYPLQVPGIQGSAHFQDVTSPYSGEVLTRVEQADDAAVEAGLSLAAQTFQDTMVKMSPYRRAEILDNLADQMKDRHDELSLTIAQEGGNRSRMPALKSPGQSTR